MKASETQELLRLMRRLVEHLELDFEEELADSERYEVMVTHLGVRGDSMSPTFTSAPPGKRWRIVKVLSNTLDSVHVVWTRKRL